MKRALCLADPPPDELLQKPFNVEVKLNTREVLVVAFTQLDQLPVKIEPIVNVEFAASRLRSLDGLADNVLGVLLEYWKHCLNQDRQRRHSLDLGHASVALLHLGHTLDDQLAHFDDMGELPRFSIFRKLGLHNLMIQVPS
ncbi:hypothetical protein HYQ46_001914 [Verticillium longisporum]|nr:hypothetical protein HYQ46_001914 [Verticillium longisporum]